MVAALLRQPEVRLLTLTGPGGVGKTRLAIAVASSLGEVFADGVAFVPLAAIGDPALVAPSIVQAFGLREVSDRSATDHLIEHLRSRTLLLVLDNFEQVVAAAPLLTGLLTACPHLTILVTSRTVLSVSGERQFPVPPLSVEESRSRAVAPLVTPSPITHHPSPAVELFVERAQAEIPNFRLTAANAAAVAAICERLEGLPLAIELAAARVRLLSAPALLVRLEQRLPLLTGGRRDAPIRQRTMRDAIAWSHDLLSPEEQTVFRRLAIFVGGFTVEAAEAVAASAAGKGTESDIFERLTALVDASLLRHEQRPDGESRLVMLETIREYALDQLVARHEDAETRQRHAAWCANLAERAIAELRSNASEAWITRLIADHDNLRAALEWAAEGGEPALGLRLAGALWRFWWVTGHLGEGRERLRRSLAAPGSEDATPDVRARALTGLGYLALYQGEFAEASASLNDALTLRRGMGNQAGEALALQMLGELAEHRDDDEQATTRYEEALALYRALGAQREVAVMLESLADAAYRRGDLSRSEALNSEALAIGRTEGEARLATLVLVGAAQIASARGDHPAAAAWLAESLTRANDSGFWIGLADTLGGYAALAAATEQPSTAVRLLAAAMAICEQIGTPRLLHHEQYRRTLATVQQRLDKDEFAAARAAGRGLTLEQVQTEAEAALHAASSTATGAAASPAERFGLTPRELEVLRLIAKGRADRQIAADLYISHNTVMRHVQHILAKLEVDSRTAAATQALRLGLV